MFPVRSNDKYLLPFFLALVTISICIFFAAFQHAKRTVKAGRRKLPPLVLNQPLLSDNVIQTWFNLLDQGQVVQLRQMIRTQFSLPQSSSGIKGKRFTFITGRWPKTACVIALRNTYSFEVILPRTRWEVERDRIKEEIRLLTSKIVWEFVADYLKTLVQDEGGDVTGVSVAGAKWARSRTAVNARGVQYVVIFPNAGDARSIVEGFGGRVMGVQGLIDMLK